MLLEMTVIDARQGSERSIEVRAQPHDTAGALLEALGSSAGTVMLVDGRPVPIDSPIGMPPLLDGSTVVLDGETPSVMKNTAPSPLRLSTTTGPDAGRTHDLTPGRHVVGRGEMASFRIADDTLSREHVAICVDRDGVLVRELDPTNASLVDGVAVPSEGVRARVGSSVRAGNTTIAVEAPRSRPVRRHPSGAGTVLVNPTPYLSTGRTPERIRVPQEPSAPARRRIPWVMVLLPLPFAALLAFFFGPRMLLFGLLTPVLAIGSTLSDRSAALRDHRAALRRWSRDRAEAGEQLARALAVERRERVRSAPDATVLLDAARGGSPGLWERRRGHPEHLDLRLGLAALPARLEVDHGHAEHAHPVLRDVPLVVDLAQVGVLGVAGERATRDRLARHILGQLTVLHSHHDVRISVVADEGWSSPFRRLVHLRDHGDVPGSSRMATTQEEATQLFARHATTVHERRRPRGIAVDDEDPTPLVLIVDDADRWRGDRQLRAVLAQGRTHHVLVIALADSVDGLPHECAAIARLDGNDLTLGISGAPTLRGIIDGVGDGWAQRVTAALGPLRDATPDASEGELPQHARLVELLGIDPDDQTAIRDVWTDTSIESGDLDVVVGQGTDGQFRLDLRHDGPHALVAGTTGSGKSEFLQGWVAALATRLSPHDITFILVDYKGGAAFAECAHLPHTVGVLTDLDPAEAERALSSLDAELTRRERILAASGATDIDTHRGDPLPRLMIVIDEFRMLAEEQPEALSRLMRIAAVGRSLGVHLVLATQRPGGIVSADIKANVNLRIALRVRDRVDSEDVLGVPDAVDLPVAAPGRALARTGGSPPRVFQTGRVAGGDTPDHDGVLLRSPGQAWPVRPLPPDRPSDLKRLSATLTGVATSLMITEPHRPWLPPLPQTITAGDLPDIAGETGAPFAMVDRPERQCREALAWSPAEGHWMVVGGPGTGRTTTVAAIVAAAAHRFTPDRVQVQVVGDGSSRTTDLADLPHVGSVVDGEDRPVVRRFLTRLEADVASRRTRLRASGYPTLDAWWTAHDTDPAVEPPPAYLLLAVDGWARLVQPPGGSDLGETAELVESLVRDGTALGVCWVAAGGRELLSGRVSSLMSTRLVLHLPDRGDAALAGLTATQVSAPRIPGRARLQPGGHLLQVMLPQIRDQDDGEPGWTGVRPWVVAALPQETSGHEIPPPSPDRIPVGLGGSGRDPVVWHAPGARRMLVCGPPDSGRTTALTTIAVQMLTSGRPVALIGGHDLTGHPGLAGAMVCNPQERDRLIALRRQHPDLAVVIDNVDQVEDDPVADVITEILRRVDADRGIVVGSTTTQIATTRLRGLVADIGRSHAGVLLQPARRSDGDPFGIRVPPLHRIPGRGYLITQGRAEEVQLARVRSDAEDGPLAGEDNGKRQSWDRPDSGHHSDPHDEA